MKKNNGSYIISTGMLVGIARLLLSTIEDSSVILIFMAAVNYIALFLVINDIRHNVVSYCTEKINLSGCDTETKKLLKTKLKLPVCVFIGVYLILGVLYIKYLKTTDLNDFISIIALSLSIATAELTDSIQKKCYKLLIRSKLKDTP